MSDGQWIRGSRRSHWVVDGKAICAAIVLADGKPRLSRFKDPVAEAPLTSGNEVHCYLCERLRIPPCPDCGSIESQRLEGGACVNETTCTQRQKRNDSRVGGLS